MFCQNCGTEIPDGAAFCPNCGAKSTSHVEDIRDKVMDGVNAAEREVGEVIDAVTGSYNHSGGQGGSGGAPLKTDRSLVSYILLTIITCGIYSYYFIYTIARDINVACKNDGKETAGLVMFIILGIVTCGIYTWYWYYALGNRLAENAPRYGMSFQENGTTVLLWLIFGSFICGIGPFIAMHILIKNTNAICVAYNSNRGYH